MVTLPVVVFQAPHERAAVARLVRFCLELDGTEVQVIAAPEPEGLRYPGIANWAYKHTCRIMAGKPFIWLEADAVPLKAGWVKALSGEYARVGKPYLLPAKYNPPHDTSTAIGVHPANASNVVPDGFTADGFDGWLYKNSSELIGGTDLIRHSYGTYDAKGDVTPHQFPRDQPILGDAVLFHKNASQSLMDIVLPGKGFDTDTVHVSTAGDLGDIVVLLASLKHIGKPVRLYLRDSGGTKGIVGRADLIRPLVEAQPYIESVRIWRNDYIDWSSEEFRKGWHHTTQSLANSHARHALFKGIIPTMPDTKQPWITAPPAPAGCGRVVINRSPRYRNQHFPWQKIVNKYVNNLLFIGTAEDHQDFCRQFGQVEWCPTKNMLEVAGIIAASLLFIGNQSACMTIAEALKHPRIQEGCLFCPDCVYPSSTNAQYVFDGAVTLPDFYDGKPTTLPSVIAINAKTFHTNEVPRGGWRYDAGAHGNLKRSNLDLLTRDVAKLMQANRDSVREAIIRQTALAVPDFFTSSINLHEFGPAVRALRDAGLSSPLVDAVEGRTPIQVL